MFNSLRSIALHSSMFIKFMIVLELFWTFILLNGIIQGEYIKSFWRLVVCMCIGYMAFVVHRDDMKKARELREAQQREQQAMQDRQQQAMQDRQQRIPWHPYTEGDDCSHTWNSLTPKVDYNAIPSVYRHGL